MVKHSLESSLQSQLDYVYSGQIDVLDLSHLASPLSYEHLLRFG